MPEVALTMNSKSIHYHQSKVRRLEFGSSLYHPNCLLAPESDRLCWLLLAAPALFGFPISAA